MKSPSPAFLKILKIALLTLILGLGSFLRFNQIGTDSFWLDEAFTYIVSKGNLIESIGKDPNMFPYSVLVHIWIKIFPNASEGLHRALSAIFSVASIPVIYLLGRKIMRNQFKATAIGLIAAFLISINAYHIEYAQEFRGYSLTFFLTTLSTYLFIRTMEDKKTISPWSLGYVIFSAAAVYSHFYAILIIAAQLVTIPIFLLDKSKPIIFKRVMVYALGILCFILPISVIAYMKGSGQINWLSAPTFESIKDLFHKITGYQDNFGVLLYLFFGYVGFMAGVAFSFRKNFITGWKFVLMGSCFLFPVIFSLFFSKIAFPIFHPRYLLFIMAYLSIMAATGIVLLATYRWERKIYRFISAPIGMSVLVLLTFLSAEGIQSYYGFQKEDWRSTSQLLSARCSESLRMYYQPYVERPALYYNQDLYSQYPEWMNTIQSTIVDSTDLPASIPIEYNQVCLVLSHYQFHEGEEKVKIIQDAILKEYPTVSIYNYYQVEIRIYNRLGN